MEAVSWRCWTRVTRQRTMEFTEGRALVAVERDGVLVSCRGMEMVGLLDRFAAGVVTTEPTIDARMLFS